MNQLRQAFRELPAVEGTDFWSDVRRSIRGHMETENPNEFLSWPELTTTMFPGTSKRTRDQYNILSASIEGRRWLTCVKESGCGSPDRLDIAGWTSGNLVQQAMHLYTWEDLTGERVANLGSIVELGGGYGALAKVVRASGYGGSYTIYDLPELSLLQRYYLECANVEATLKVDPEPVECDLFIALWSISEMQAETQARWLESIKAKHYLLAMMDAPWEGIDNKGLIKQLAREKGFAKLIMAHQPENYYLVG